MTYISSVDTNGNINNKKAIYNAVKIQINNPQANINNSEKSTLENDGVFNAVDIEVNEPKLDIGKKHPHKELYNYPQSPRPITSDIAPIHAINIPQLPVAYQTNNYINNRTLVNAEFEFENKMQKLNENAILDNQAIVPEPNVTTTELSKQNIDDINFKGLNFKANEQHPVHKVEIVPPVELKPEVDINAVIKNLTSTDYDVQAKQMEEIARVSMEDSQNAIPYIVTEIFAELENIVKKDSSNLEPPSEKQIALRKKIILNEIAKEQTTINNQDPNNVVLPFDITEQEIKEAAHLSQMEQAERNKEYALYTMAILTKVYVDEVEKHTGNVVPLTDLPGMSTVVDTLREDSNFGVKISAIDCLRYINRPEYKDEISSIFKLASNDTNPYVAQNAAMILENID